MNRWIKAIANRCVFASSKNRVDVRTAKASDHATFHAPAVHALYTLHGYLRGLLCAGRAPYGAGMARQTERSTQSWQTWTSAMPCQMVRRRSPVVVVVT